MGRDGPREDLLAFCIRLVRRAGENFSFVKKGATRLSPRGPMTKFSRGGRKKKRGKKGVRSCQRRNERLYENESGWYAMYTVVEDLRGVESIRTFDRVADGYSSPCSKTCPWIKRSVISIQSRYYPPDQSISVLACIEL